jgi:serine phosphatase RsbU (regulator of sigma subunit)
LVLAMRPDSVYVWFDVAFEPGERLLQYTDGLSEAGRANGDEFFGDGELARVLASTPGSEDLMRAILEAHRHWIGEGAPLSDDVSVVSIDRVELTRPAQVLAMPAGGS